MQLHTPEFHSEILGRAVKMNVLVPDSGKERYPVVYMHHGLGDTFEAFCNRSGLREHAQRLDLIIAMPDAGASWYCNDPRPDGFSWEDHLAGEVVDYVDADFPTIAVREGRGQGGFSMGGYGAMMLGLRHPDRFSVVSTIAGSFLFGHALRPDRPERSAFMQAVAPPGGKYDLWEVVKTLADAPSMHIRIDVGTSDHLLDYNRQLHALMEELGVAHEYEEDEGGHQWVFVNRRLPTTLEFVCRHLAAAD